MQHHIRGSTFYCVDTLTGKRTSLKTQARDEAARLIQAKNEAERQPMINVQIAKAIWPRAPRVMGAFGLVCQRASPPNVCGNEVAR